MLRDGLRILFARPLVERPALTTLTVLGVACGVALYVALALLRTATLEQFSKSISPLAGDAAMTVEGESGFPEQTLDVVERVPGVDRVAPVVLVRGRLGDHGVVVLGVDMLRETAVRAHTLDDDVDDPLELLADADAVLVPRSLAKERALARGDRLVVETASGEKELVVRGVVRDSGAARAFGGRVVFMDIDAARVTFGREGLTDRLDVRAKHGVDEKRLAADLAAAAPGLRVEKPGDQTAAFRAMIGSYDRVLAELARLALVVAMLLVGSALQLTVAERRREIGVLRALGATRALVVGVFLAQAVVLGLAGGALGLGAGRVLAATFVSDLSQSTRIVTESAGLDDLAPLDAHAIHVDSWMAAVALATGVAAASCGALFPALRAASVPPVAALVPKGVALAAPRRASLLRLAIGAVFLASACGPVLAYDALPSWMRDATLTLAFIGAALVAPLATKAAAIAWSWLVSRTALGRAPFVHLATRSLRAPGRTDAAAALAVSLVVVLLVAAAQASLRSALATATARMLAADVWVSESGQFVSGRSAPLAPEIADAIAQVPGVASVGALRVAQTRADGAPILVKAWENAGTLPIVALEGDPASMHGAEPAVLVSESFAQRTGTRRGGLVVLDTPSGPARFVVRGIVVDFASESGVVYVDRVRFARLFHDDRVTAFYVRARAGVSPSVLRDRIDAAVGRPRGVVVRDTSALRAMSERALDEGFAYATAMQTSALCVSLLALMAGVLANVLERRRELGVLRALGASARSVAATIAFESCAVGLGAATTAVALGAYLARTWIGAGLARQIGWPVEPVVPATAALATLAAGLLVGVIAGACGARATARLRPAIALRA